MILAYDLDMMFIPRTHQPGYIEQARVLVDAVGRPVGKRGLLAYEFGLGEARHLAEGRVQFAVDLVIWLRDLP